VSDFSLPLWLLAQPSSKQGLPDPLKSQPKPSNVIWPAVVAGQEKWATVALGLLSPTLLITLSLIEPLIKSKTQGWGV
jgi:hypothetical protein